jgi:hypothetical protein
LAIGGLLWVQQPAERPFKIVRLDPALDGIVAPNAKLKTPGEHFRVHRGPGVDSRR